MEVTILLSNTQYNEKIDAKKVIKLKSIRQIEQPTANQSTFSKERLITLEQKIAHAQRTLQQLKQEHTNVIEKTRNTIKQEQEQWEQEKQTLINEAEKLGYHEGFAQGETEGLRQYEEKINEANHLVKTARNDYETTVLHSKDTIIQLALTTAEKIINDHIQNEPAAFKSIVEAALETIRNDEYISIYVHPNQFDFLIKQKGELMNSVDGQTHLEIFIDHNLTEMSCMIEHPFGRVDASIDTQLDQIRSILQNVSNGE